MKKGILLALIVFSFSGSYLPSVSSTELGPEGLNCPTLSGSTNSTLTTSLDIKALSFNGQYFQRVDSKSGKLIDKPQGYIGCYKHFSTVTGYDARWEVGVIDYINGKLKWINHAGRSWDLIADFSNSRFLTNETNPYFPAFFAIDRPFDPKTGDSASCKPLRRSGVGFPANNSKINSTPEPIFLAVLIDFKEQYSAGLDKELSRFDFEKVENFWFKNSYQKSNLKIEKYPATVLLDQSASLYEGGKEGQLFPLVVNKIRNSVDLARYSGFVFATPASGPRLQAGYAAHLVNSKEPNKIVWMGGWNSTRENFVPVWKVVTHEFGHSYGLPDLYFTNGNYNSGKTLGPFDLMNGVAGISNSITFFQRWMLGWITDVEVSCVIPEATPFSIELKPVNVLGSVFKGVIVPISEFESILIEARVSTEFDDLKSDQEGVLVYLSDTRIPSGRGPLRIIPSNNPLTLDPKSMDDIERYKFGTLRIGERVSYGNIFVEYTRRSGEIFQVTVTKGNDFFVAADKAAAELRAKQEAEKVEAELKAKQEALAKATAIKKTTITCAKGKVTKKVTAVKPKCPSGYKKK